MSQLAAVLIGEMQTELWKSDGNWFVEWFNCSAYHVLYGNRDEEEAQRFIEVLAQKHFPNPPARILDLACGAGRHVRGMEAMGYTSYGVDLSTQSIDVARANSTFPERFQVQDMRTFATGLNWSKSFDVITCLFTSFGYFEKMSDLETTLSQIHLALRPDGTFILDFLNVHQVAKNLVTSERISRLDGEGKAIDFQLNRRIHEGWVEKSIQYTDLLGSHHFVERVRALDRETLESLLSSAGFRIRTVHGDYALEPYTNTSNRCILVASCS